MRLSGAKVRPEFPYHYREYWVTRRNGRIYGIPCHLAREEPEDVGDLVPHPAILAGATREEVETQIDQVPAALTKSTRLGSYGEYSLYRHRERIYGVPLRMGAPDLNLAEERDQAGIVCGTTLGEVQARIREARAAVPVEF